MTLIDAKFDADLINISEVMSRKTKWPRFFGLPYSLGVSAFLFEIAISHVGLRFNSLSYIFRS